MKLLVAFSTFFVLARASPSPLFVKPGEVTADTHENFLDQVHLASSGARIASGVDAKTGEFPEFCYLSVQFYQKVQTCGCWIFDELHVVTSARCVFECSEGNAANVTVTFPALSGAAAVRKIAKIFTPSGTNGNAKLTAYSTVDDGKDGNFKNIGPNNVAIIRLQTKFTLGTGNDKAVNKAKFAEMPSFDTWNLTHPTRDWRFRACGIGWTNNQGLRAKGVSCAEVRVVSADECAEQYDITKKYTIPDGDLCLQWGDRDNNACIADFGGPVYAYKLDPTTNNIDINSQEIFCTLVASPNVRKSAPCLDGHVTFCQHNIGLGTDMNALAWFRAIINEP